MKRGTSNVEVKRLNRNRVFRYVNSREKTSMPDIAASLGMSGPTVLQIVKELKELQILQEVGEFQSTGGRKAKAIAPVQDARYAVGLDITRNHVSIVLTDLSEKVLKHIRIRKPFICEDDYFDQIGELLDGFIENCNIVREKIIGVGIAVPGIVDGMQNNLTYSHALDIRDISCEEFSRSIPYPCVLINDANAAAMTEYTNSDRPENIVYLSLSNSVGGAIVFRKERNLANVGNSHDGFFGSMYMGNFWRSGEFGHIVIHPEGPHCYCGKKGCLDFYCSALRLADLTDGNLEEYFLKMENGNKQFAEVWEEYLENLAIGVDNLRMCFDCDVILGGYVGSYMEPYLRRFQKKAARKNIFENCGEYVKACRYRVEASALGAAIYQIEKYMDSI